MTVARMMARNLDLNRQEIGLIKMNKTGHLLLILYNFKNAITSSQGRIHTC
jgi:hypothetical protein